nr:uncharacterized protein LOC103247525 [Chlorocebus sabaeus]
MVAGRAAERADSRRAGAESEWRASLAQPCRRRDRKDGAATAQPLRRRRHAHPRLHAPSRRAHWLRRPATTRPRLRAAPPRAAGNPAAPRPVHQRTASIGCAPRRRPASHPEVTPLPVPERAGGRLRSGSDPVTLSRVPLRETPFPAGVYPGDPAPPSAPVLGRAAEAGAGGWGRLWRLERLLGGGTGGPEVTEAWVGLTLGPCCGEGVETKHIPEALLGHRRWTVSSEDPGPSQAPCRRPGAVWVPGRGGEFAGALRPTGLCSFPSLSEAAQDGALVLVFSASEPGPELLFPDEAGSHLLWPGFQALGPGTRRSLSKSAKPVLGERRRFLPCGWGRLTTSRH